MTAARARAMPCNVQSLRRARSSEGPSEAMPRVNGHAPKGRARPAGAC